MKKKQAINEAQVVALQKIAGISPTVNEEETTIQEETPNQRMSGLINRNDLSNFLSSADRIINDLVEDGFEPEEAYEYLARALKVSYQKTPYNQGQNLPVGMPKEATTVKE